ncbi:hypothetical protein M422DRAFT_238857 [Sphaerobolus stellatus SS14]|nr:hypothetical protein M422DRAFT_238857 [Sphaerobolus stellatus SS14]
MERAAYQRRGHRRRFFVILDVPKGDTVTPSRRSHAVPSSTQFGADYSLRPHNHPSDPSRQVPANGIPHIMVSPPPKPPAVHRRQEFSPPARLHHDARLRHPPIVFESRP